MQSIMWLLSIIKLKRRLINEEGILPFSPGIEGTVLAFHIKTLQGNPVFVNITSSC